LLIRFQVTVENVGDFLRHSVVNFVPKFVAIARGVGKGEI